jgi:flagellar protein FlgJ
MDIGILGSSYLDEARFAVSSLGISGRAGEEPSPASLGTGDVPSFAKLLDQARHTENRAAEPGTSGKAASKKPVVDKTDKLYEQCEALETFLVKTLITGMRNTVQKSGFIDEGFAGKMYEDMLYDEYAKDFTKNAGFGLAELAYLELTGQRGKIIASHA